MTLEGDVFGAAVVDGSRRMLLMDSPLSQGKGEMLWRRQKWKDNDREWSQRERGDLSERSVKW